MIPLTLTPGQTYTVNDDFVKAYYTGSDIPTQYFVHNGALQGESFTAIAERDYYLVVEATKPATPDPVTNVTCSDCGHVYPSNTTHTCAKDTCPNCGLNYIKAQGHTCSIPADPTTYNVHFVVDNAIYWTVEVMTGKTVKAPGIAQGSNWECLKNVGDKQNRVFMGWSTNSKATTGDFSTDSVVQQIITGGDRTYYAIYKDVAVAPPTSSNGNGITNKDNTNKVYLHIYVNGNASSIALTRDITNTYLLDDDKISNGEIWTYVKDMYYTAKDPNVGLQIDGLYVNTGSNGTFPQNYYTDTKQDTLSGIKALLDNGYVHVNIMLKNAVSYASLESGSKANADSSNPKTGDMIIAPVAVMGMSVSALAVLFYLNKKRQF
jgi:hypothetical protein